AEGVDSRKLRYSRLERRHGRHARHHAAAAVRGGADAALVRARPDRDREVGGARWRTLPSAVLERISAGTRSCMASISISTTANSWSYSALRAAENRRFSG